MAETLTILSPLDVKPGTVAPDGRIVAKSTMYVSEDFVATEVVFDDGSLKAFAWPNGKGWVVDGQVGK